MPFDLVEQTIDLLRDFAKASNNDERVTILASVAESEAKMTKNQKHQYIFQLAAAVLKSTPDEIEFSYQLEGKTPDEIARILQAARLAFLKVENDRVLTSITMQALESLRGISSSVDVLAAVRVLSTMVLSSSDRPTSRLN